MKELSVFDILGPIMVGPSSSHTAGALKIASVISKMANSKIIDVTFTLYGSFSTTYKGHGTDRALLAGILGFETDNINIKNSLDIATEQKISYKFIPDFDTKTDHPNTIKIEALTQGGQRLSLTGVSTGGGAIKITMINQTKVNFTGEYYTLLIEQKDEPGVIAEISSALSSVNIAFMRVFRTLKGGIAYTIIETDEIVSKDVISSLSNCNHIRDISVISI